VTDPNSRTGGVRGDNRQLRAAASGPLARRLSPRYLEEHCLLPLEVDEAGRLTVAIGQQPDPTVLDELRLTFERQLKLIEVPAAEIQAAIMSAQDEPSSDSEAMDLQTADLQVLGPEDDALDDLRSLASQPPVIKLVNLTVLEAVKHRASDVHVECTSEGLRIRHRIDGVLHDVATHPKQYQAAVISRIKIMADLNIAERRVPQDGRIRLRLSDREIDLRVSTLPAVHGESVVLRILDRGTAVRGLGKLGMAPDTEASFERLVTRPHGIILATGPTGSGKTTSLYAALQRINRPGIKIITAEDPVEYQLEGVTQIPVDAKVGRTFAAVLRSILRHDPDVVMVGEMRDRETAEIAIQAALTGHLVFSTLHTNDAPGGITRLVDMGIEPYLVAATVQGILAQRLVRVVCDQCGVSYTPTAEESKLASDAGYSKAKQKFRLGRGCDACANTGYIGRAGVYELMLMNDDLRHGVVEGHSLDSIRELARSSGMVPLYQAAWEKACAGSTTVEEVLRVSRDETDR
jgi:general secretion pathway protein E